MKGVKLENYTEDRRSEDKSLSSNLAAIAESISHLKEDVAELKQDFKKLNQIYVTKIEFAPVKTIAFGVVLPL